MNDRSSSARDLLGRIAEVENDSAESGLGSPWIDHIRKTSEAHRNLAEHAHFMLDAWDAKPGGAYPDMTRRERHNANLVLDELIAVYGEPGSGWASASAPAEVVPTEVVPTREEFELLRALKPTAQFGRLVAESLRLYERSGGRRVLNL